MDEQQFQEMSQMYGSPAPMYPSSQMNNGNMLVMTDPEAEVERLEQYFKGRVMNEKGEYIKAFKPTMNEYGISEIIGLLRSVVNRVTFMSNINEKGIWNIMDHMAETLAKVLMVNKRKYGIVSDADRSSVYFKTLTTGYIAILRGKDGDDKKFWKSTVQEINYGMNSNQPQRQQGMLSKISPSSWSR